MAWESDDMDTTYDIWLNELRMFRRTRIIVRTPLSRPTGARIQAPTQGRIQSSTPAADAA
jgi:hypothetical protein